MTLVELAQKHGTDKHGPGLHFYAPHYERHFLPYRYGHIKLLEIGIGGYEDPNKGGQSLRMWREYFPRAEIFGFDLFDKSGVDSERIKTIKGDQSHPQTLLRLNEEHGPFDIIIDDGSHFSSHVITTFETLFPLLSANGIYSVEDLQTSYWPGEWGGADDQTARTSMNYLKGLADCLNHVERVGHEPSYFDRHIVGLSFYHNLCFITKGVNDEPSNFLKK